MGWKCPFGAPFWSVPASAWAEQGVDGRGGLGLHGGKDVGVQIQGDPTLACPRRSETTLGWTLESRSNVAWAWRRSWNRTWGRPERLRKEYHPEDRVSGWRGLPSPRVRSPGPGRP